MLDSLRPSYGSSEGNKKGINKHYNETDMEVDLELDSDYEMYMSHLKPGYDDNVIGESSSVHCMSSSGHWERKRIFKSDSKRVKAKFPGTSGGISMKPKTRMPKTVKKSSKIRVEESENEVRNAPSEERKCVDIENEINGEPFMKKNSGKDVECVSYESDETSIHQSDDECGSDLEILASDNLPFHEGQYTPFVSSKCYQLLGDEDSWDGNRTSTQSQFREKLMDLLDIPYDQNEYESLWEEVTYKRPVQGLRELRGGISKRYPKNIEGKSYLDWYIDLKEKVDECDRDQRKILCLLRGFFLWLKNTAHEGAFKPWLDSKYLKALG